MLTNALFIFKYIKIYLIFSSSVSATPERPKGIRNKTFKKSASTETRYKGRGNETIDTATSNKHLNNLAMSSTAVNSYSSMDSPIFGIPQHRKVRRGLSDIDPKYVSQVRFNYTTASILKI